MESASKGPVPPRFATGPAAAHLEPNFSASGPSSAPAEEAKSGQSARLSDEQRQDIERLRQRARAHQNSFLGSRHAPLPSQLPSVHELLDQLAHNVASARYSRDVPNTPLPPAPPSELAQQGFDWRVVADRAAAALEAGTKRPLPLANDPEARNIPGLDLIAQMHHLDLSQAANESIEPNLDPAAQGEVDVADAESAADSAAAADAVSAAVPDVQSAVAPAEEAAPIAPAGDPMPSAPAAPSKPENSNETSQEDSQAEESLPEVSLSDEFLEDEISLDEEISVVEETPVEGEIPPVVSDSVDSDQDSSGGPVLPAGAGQLGTDSAQHLPTGDPSAEISEQPRTEEHIIGVNEPDEDEPIPGAPGLRAEGGMDASLAIHGAPNLHPEGGVDSHGAIPGAPNLHPRGAAGLHFERSEHHGEIAPDSSEIAADLDQDLPEISVDAVDVSDLEVEGMELELDPEVEVALPLEGQDADAQSAAVEVPVDDLAFEQSLAGDALAQPAADGEDENLNTVQNIVPPVPAPPAESNFAPVEAVAGTDESPASVEDEFFTAPAQAAEATEAPKRSFWKQLFGKS